MSNATDKHRTIRIRLDTYRRLKILAAKMGMSMVMLIESWVTESEQKWDKKTDSEGKRDKAD